MCHMPFKALTTKVAFQVSILTIIFCLFQERKQTFYFLLILPTPLKFCVHPNRKRKKHSFDFHRLGKNFSPCLNGKAAAIKCICYCQKYISAGGRCYSLFIKAEGDGSLEHALQLLTETSVTGSEFPALKHFAAPAERSCSWHEAATPPFWAPACFPIWAGCGSLCPVSS